MSEFVPALLTLLGLGIICRSARKALLTPLHPGEDLRLSLRVSAKGEAEKLAETVDALCFLRSAGALPAEIVIVDEGMNGEARRAAARLAVGTNGVRLWTREKNRNS